MATAEATESTREFSSDTQELGDRIVGLTLKAAKELSDYLDEVHGIKPASGGAVMVALVLLLAEKVVETLPLKRLSLMWS